MLAGIVIVTVVALVVVHLIGGLFHHTRHYRRHGMHPNLMYTYGRGWYGSVRLGGFRVGHRL